LKLFEMVQMPPLVYAKTANPRQQGLKPLHDQGTVFQQHAKTANPRQQGLKHGGVATCDSDGTSQNG